MPCRWRPGAAQHRKCFYSFLRLFLLFLHQDSFCFFGYSVIQLLFLQFFYPRLKFIIYFIWLTIISYPLKRLQEFADLRFNTKFKHFKPHNVCNFHNLFFGEFSNFREEVSSRWIFLSILFIF